MSSKLRAVSSIRGRTCINGRTHKRLYATESINGEQTSDKWHGSYHWTYERILSLITLGLVGGAFAVYPNKMIDFGLGLVLPLHSHIGFSSIITDYLPKRKFPKIYPVAMSALYALTGLTLFGLYEFNTKGPGICEGVATLWTAHRARKEDDLD